MFNPSRTVDFAIPEDWVYNGLDYGELQSILDDEGNIGLDVLLVFDDVVSDMKTCSKELRKVFRNRRHVFADGEGGGSLSVITTTQKYNALPLELRNEVTSVFAFRMPPRESQTFYLEVMDEFLPTPDAWRSFQGIVFNEAFVFLYIDKDRKRLYRNFQRLLLEVRSDTAQGRVQMRF